MHRTIHSRDKQRRDLYATVTYRATRRLSARPLDYFRQTHLYSLNDVTGVFCTSGSEREFTLEGSWYADEEIQAGADRNAAAAD